MFSAFLGTIRLGGVDTLDMRPDRSGAKLVFDKSDSNSAIIADSGGRVFARRIELSQKESFSKPSFSFILNLN